MSFILIVENKYEYLITYYVVKIYKITPDHLELVFTYVKWTLLCLRVISTSTNYFATLQTIWTRISTWLFSGNKDTVRKRLEGYNLQLTKVITIVPLKSLSPTHPLQRFNNSPSKSSSLYHKSVHSFRKTTSAFSTIWFFWLTHSFTLIWITHIMVKI